MSEQVCEARGCLRRAITAFADGAGEVWSLCEFHGDLLAVGFSTDRCAGSSGDVQ